MRIIQRIIQGVPPSEWYDRAEDDVLQEQSDGAPSGGVGEHAVGSSGGRGGAERGERTGDMNASQPTPTLPQLPKRCRRPKLGYKYTVTFESTVGKKDICSDGLARHEQPTCRAVHS